MTTPVAISDELQQLEEKHKELSRQLAEARRNIPSIGVQDYAFRNPDGSEVRLSELFADRNELLVIHNMGRKCAWCTLWADGFNGIAHHLESRAAFVLASPDDPATQKEFVESRGWRFRTVSCAGNSFAHDLGFEPEPGKYWPGVSAFRKNEDGTIQRTAHATFGPDDEFCSAWHLFRMLPNGINDWAPKFDYSG